MRTLIIKFGAAGDVVRTTSILNVLHGEKHFLTSDDNVVLLKDNPKIEKCFAWADAARLSGSRYDLIINLEDSYEASHLLDEIEYKALFGAYLNESETSTYTESSKE